jgi:hypothetical protein
MTRRYFVVSGGLLLALATLAIGCAEKPKTPAKADAGKGTAAAADSAAGQSAADEGEDAKDIREAMAKLPEADRKLAEAQGVCPVSGKPLGSMGMPLKVTVKERDVFLCCEGCKESLEKDPDKFFAKIDEKKAK